MAKQLEAVHNVGHVDALALAGLEVLRQQLGLAGLYPLHEGLLVLGVRDGLVVKRAVQPLPQQAVVPRCMAEDGAQGVVLEAISLACGHGVAQYAEVLQAQCGDVHAGVDVAAQGLHVYLAAHGHERHRTAHRHRQCCRCRHGEA